MSFVKKYALSFILLFSFGVTGCGGSAPSPENNEGDLLATMVAATVDAALDAPQADAAPATNAPAAAPPPTEIPAAAPTAAAPAVIATVPPLPDRPLVLRVAYVKDGNVYVWTEGRGRVALTGEGDVTRVSISDDGRVIAFVRQDAANLFRQELWAVNVDAPGSARVLVGAAEMDALRAASPFDFAVGLGFDALAWRPRTHQLAYGTVPLYDGPGYQPSEDLRLVDADTLAKTTLFDFGEGGAFVFSPDGNQVALSTPEQIGLINADGSNFRPNLLSYPLVGTYSEYQYHPKPIWAADSASLRVAIPPADTLAYPSLMTSLWLIPVDGSPAVQIGNMPSISFDWPDNAFAPHLFQIAYVKQIGNATDEQYELHIATVDGSTDYVFTTGKGLHFIEWSPNGARFLYSANGDGNQGVFLGDGLGNIYTVSSISNVMAQMHWVDNSRFLYLYQNGGSWELRISDVDGTNHAFLDTFAERYVSYDFVK